MRTLLRNVLVYLYAMTWNATGYAVTGDTPEASPLRASTEAAGSAEGSTMATEDPTNLLYSFRGAYGRLCHLTCKALHDRAPQNLVLEAFEGGGSQMAPVLHGIRTAYVECNEALRRAATEHTSQEITRVAVEMRRAHEREWDVEVPTVATA